MTAADTNDIEAFCALSDDIRAELLKMGRILETARWKGTARYFAPGRRGGHILQFLDCTKHQDGYGHDLQCYEPIECVLDYEDPETGELFAFHPVDPTLSKRQLKALLGVTTTTFNDISPDIDGRLATWRVRAATAPFMRQLFADPENPWPTKADRRWMRQQRKNGGRGQRRHHCGPGCDNHPRRGE